MQSIDRHRKQLEGILDRALAGLRPDSGEIGFLLSVSDKDELDSLFETARLVRRRWFEDKIFLYGFIYFSTFCRNDCSFCHYRKSNTALQRYRKTAAEVMETAETLAVSGVHLVDLTMGEPPASAPGKEPDTSFLVQMVADIKRELSMPVMVSPGVARDSLLQDLAAAGADWYACYQETHNRRLFSELRLGQDYDERMGAKLAARRLGMLIEEGLLIGVGESARDVSDSFEAMLRIGADQVRVMTFVPQQGTPMAGWNGHDSTREEVVIAVMRLAFPEQLIPASLDVGGLAGLKRRLEAGANVVTSLVVPGRGLAGVANKVLDIEHARRTPKAVQPILEACGLEAASRSDYCRWMEKHRPKPAACGGVEGLAC